MRDEPLRAPAVHHVGPAPGPAAPARGAVADRPPTRSLAPSTPAIETRGLTKRFGHRTAVSDLSIEVPDGVICGFVGPNGSGKTTTIRMLLGLVAPSSGDARVLGHPIARPGAYLPHIGALIEGPAFYPSMSGRSNLAVLARLGGHPVARIDPLLDLVGLTGRGRDRVSAYSLGMKQRLAVAAALLSDPRLLILDEPANGLDPPGIIEVRELLRRLRDEGRTVFVSSHLLGEVEQVADWLVVLKDGGAVHCGPAESLRRGGADRLVAVPEHASQLETVAAVARDGGHTVTVRDGAVHVGAPAAYAPALNRACMQAGVTLAELRISRLTLEQAFLDAIEARP